MPEVVYILIRDLLYRRYHVEDLEEFIKRVYCGAEREDVHLEGQGIFDDLKTAQGVKAQLEDQEPQEPP